MKKSATEGTNDSTSKGVGKELTKRETTMGSAERGNKITGRLLVVILQGQF